MNGSSRIAPVSAVTPTALSAASSTTSALKTASRPVSTHRQDDEPQPKPAENGGSAEPKRNGAPAPPQTVQPPAPQQQTNGKSVAAAAAVFAQPSLPKVPLQPVTSDSKGKSAAVPELKLNGFVGFDSLPYQIVQRCKSQGFQFNILCVGETGMGKTTLIESLFNMKFEFVPCSTELKTVELRSKTADVCEGGVRVRLRVVETAGFGDQLDKDKSAKVIVDYINAQFEAYLKEELKVRRALAYYDDTRIHACLYFISPTGHGLKALDVTTMRELSKRVNVIPVIAKADTTCKDELVRFKKKILSELKANNIEIYHFPTDDETVRKENALLNTLAPFAIIGSTDFVTKEDGRSVRARRYPWGIVEVENEEHCDFVKLREALLRINEDSLRERTHGILYERYRRDRLREMKMRDGDTGSQMTEAFAARQKEFKEELAKREEHHQREFVKRVEAKDNELKRQEEAMNIRQREMRERYALQMKKLDTEMFAMVEKLRMDKVRTSGKKKRSK